MRERLRRAVDALAHEDVRALSRRYFVSNGFDGTLTSVGIVVGAYLSGVADGWVTFKVGLGAAVGLATSGVWSVWEIERAEARLEVHRVERAMLADLDDTLLERRRRSGRVVNAVLSGLGPVIGVVVPLLPFPFVGAGVTLLEATAAGVLLGVGLLFVFGAYLGAISEQNWVVAGLRMGVAGLVVALVNVALPG
ncbi:MAG: VIT1/CCC1 transporter family protein [Halobacteriaceae archaeon]